MEGNHTQERPFHTGPEKDELWYGNPNTRNYLHPILTNTYNTIPNIYHTIPNSYHQSPNFYSIKQSNTTSHQSDHPIE